MKKTFYIKTLGCKVNQYESQVIREGFLRNGYCDAGNEEEADIYVVNTCTVTSVSDSKSLKLLHSGVKNPNKCVIATGCMVEDKELDLKQLAGVKFIIKNEDKYNIPSIVEDLKSGKKNIASITRFNNHTRAFVKIQDGCNNSCSYCKVRVIRGRSRSRQPEEILDECRTLVSNGAGEIVLTGICLGSYGRDLSGKETLSNLIIQLCEIKGDWRLRLSSIEPKDITDDLIGQILFQKRLCEHLHIPFQSGDDYILKKMDRPYTRNEYLSLVGRLRDKLPEIAISTDIMVGFPGETEERFRNTIDFLNMAKPMRMHIFPFSKRNGTKAYDYKDDVGPPVKKERGDKLLDLGEAFSRDFIAKFIGRDAEVLVEHARTKKGYLQGYTRRYIKLNIEGPDSLKGKIVNCGLVGHSMAVPSL